MKKKKLKKKIEKLEYRVNYICKKLSTTIDALNLSESHVMQCKEAITRLENDNKYYKESKESNYGRIINDHASRIAVLEKKETKNEEKEAEKED